MLAAGVGWLVGVRRRENQGPAENPMTGPKPDKNGEPRRSPTPPATSGTQVLSAANWFQAALIVLVGVAVDRLRESFVGELATIVLLVSLAVVVALLAELAEHLWVPRFFLFVLVVVSYVVATAYASSPGGKMPNEWAFAVFLGALLWCMIHAGFGQRLPYRPDAPVIWSLDAAGAMWALGISGPYAFAFLTPLFSDPVAANSAWEWVVWVVLVLSSIVSTFSSTTTMSRRYTWFVVSSATMLTARIVDASLDSTWSWEPLSRNILALAIVGVLLLTLIIPRNWSTRLEPLARRS